MISIIARKELKILFATPLGWILLGITQLLIGSYFSLSFNQYIEILNYNPQLASNLGATQFLCEGVFGIASIFLMFAIPVISMNSISEERKNNTFSFLISSPISNSEIVFGKFLGLISFFALVIFSLVIMVLLMNLWTDVDIGYLFANTLGLTLLIISASAIGICYSCYTAQPILAGSLTLSTLALFLVLDHFFINQFDNVFQHISMMHHYKNFTRGMIQSYDILYFLLITIFFIYLAVRKLNALRLHG